DVGVGIDGCHRIAFVVVLQLSQGSHGEDAKTGAKNRSVVAERTVSKADAGIKIPHVGLPQTWRQTFLLIGHYRRAWKCARRRVSRICSRRVSRDRRIAGVERL